jgi:hypothetical protein
MVEATAEGAHDVAVGLAVRVRGSLVGVGTEDVRQRRRRLEARRWKLYVRNGDRLLDVLGAEAEMSADPLRRLTKLFR